jgi:hypothetical protein
MLIFIYLINYLNLIIKIGLKNNYKLIKLIILKINLKIEQKDE